MKNVYMPPPYRRDGAEFARMKRSAELALTRYRLLIWIVLALVFASRGAWELYYSLTIGSILGGFVLLILSSICTAMVVMEILDLTDDRLGG